MQSGEPRSFIKVVNYEALSIHSVLNYGNFFIGTTFNC